METKKLIESIVAKNFKGLTKEENYIYDKAIWKQEHVTNFGNYENQIEYIKGIKKGMNTYDCFNPYSNGSSFFISITGTILSLKISFQSLF